jgi:hypothetical protein
VLGPWSERRGPGAYSTVTVFARLRG